MPPNQTSVSSIVEQYQTQGYCVVQDLLDERTVQKLLEWVKKIYSSLETIDLPESHDGTPDLSQFAAAYSEKPDDYLAVSLGVLQRSLTAYAVATDAQLIELIKKLGLSAPYLNSDPLLMVHNEHFCKTVGLTTTSPFHQDWRSMQSSENSLVVWIPLTPVEPNHGGTIEVFEGSHRSGLLKAETSEWGVAITNPEKIVNQFKSVTVVASPGDAIIFSSLLVHRTITPTLKSGNTRLTLQQRYADADDKLLVANRMYFNYDHCLPKNLSGNNLLLPKSHA